MCHAVLRGERGDGTRRCRTGDATLAGIRHTDRRSNHPCAPGDRGGDFAVDRPTGRKFWPAAADAGRLGADPVAGARLRDATRSVCIGFGNLLNAFSAAIFGVTMTVVAADLTRETGGFNLTLGALGVAISIGASLSTFCTGISVALFGVRGAALSLALVGLCGTSPPLDGDARDAPDTSCGECVRLLQRVKSTPTAISPRVPTVGAVGTVGLHMAVALGLSRNLPCALYLAWCSIAERASTLPAQATSPCLAGNAPGGGIRR